MRIAARILVAVVVLAVLAPSLARAHGKGHVLGTIAAVGSDHIEVATKDSATVTVRLTKDTRFFRGDSPADASAAKVGMRVVVHLGSDGAAAEVRLPPALK